MSNSSEEVNLDSFLNAVDKLAEQLEINKTVSLADDKALEDAKSAENRSTALLQGVSSMFGLNVNSVEEAGDEMVITLDVLKLKAQLFLNKHSKLSGVKILTSEYSWVDTAKILYESSSQDPPNDLRQAISYLSNVQNAIASITKDVSEYRNVCIITQLSSHKYSFEFKNGLVVTLVFDDCYPLTPNSVIVQNIKSSDLNASEAVLESSRNEINASNFTTLSQVINYVQNLLN